MSQSETFLANNLYVFQEFSIILQEAVPQPNEHEAKEWYHPHINRAQAEEMLRHVPYDGSFLVRPAGNFNVISFR